MAHGIKVNTSPVADRYSGPAEKIIEFSSPNGGGLISFRLDPDEGTLRVEVHRTDDTVVVSADRATPWLDGDRAAVIWRTSGLDALVTTDLA